MTLKFKDDKQAALFAHKFLKLYLGHGFQSLSKKDLDLLVFFELENLGVINETDSNYEIAKKLKITQTKVKSLRENAYARWGDKNPSDIIKNVITRCFKSSSLNAALKYADKERRNQGYLPFLIEHPVERQEFEYALKKSDTIPIYERNREVILVPFESVYGLAKKEKLVPPDKELLKKVESVLADGTTLKDILQKDVTNIKWIEVRKALNNVAASLIEKGATDVLSKLGLLFVSGV